MHEMGAALKILTSEILSSVGQQVLAATVMTALMSALQWPISEFSSRHQADRSLDQARIPHRQPMVERAGSITCGRSCPSRYNHSSSRGCPACFFDRIFPWRACHLLRSHRTCSSQGIRSCSRRLHIWDDRLSLSSNMARNSLSCSWKIRQRLRYQRLDAGLPLPGNSWRIEHCCRVEADGRDSGPRERGCDRSHYRPHELSILYAPAAVASRLSGVCRILRRTRGKSKCAMLLTPGS